MLKDRFWWCLHDTDLRNATKIYALKSQTFDELIRQVKAEEYAMAVHSRKHGVAKVKEEDRTKLPSTAERKHLILR